MVPRLVRFPRPGYQPPVFVQTAAASGVSAGGVEFGLKGFLGYIVGDRAATLLKSRAEQVEDVAEVKFEAFCLRCLKEAEL